MRVKRANNHYTDRPSISLNYSRRRLVIRPPPLHVVAQLCTAIRYKCIAMPARSIESESNHDGSIRTYDFYDDWKRSVLKNSSREANGNHWPNNRHTITARGYTSGTFQGLWQGAFFVSLTSKSPHSSFTQIWTNFVVLYRHRLLSDGSLQIRARSRMFVRARRPCSITSASTTLSMSRKQCVGRRKMREGNHKQGHGSQKGCNGMSHL